MVTDTEIQTSGWCARMSAATEPFPTAVGPASTVKVLRREEGPLGALVKLTLESCDLICSKTSYAPRRRDAESVHQVLRAYFA